MNVIKVAQNSYRVARKATLEKKLISALMAKNIDYQKTKILLDKIEKI